jgi:hypothetical protein
MMRDLGLDDDAESLELARDEISKVLRRNPETRRQRFQVMDVDTPRR